MKRFQCLLSCTLTFWLVTLSNGTACAQTSLLNRTSINIPTYRTEKSEVSLRFNDGSSFVGQKNVTYANTQIISISHAGTLTYPDGTKVISIQGTGFFDQNFAANGSFGVEKEGMLYFFYFKQGHMQQQFTPERNHYYTDHCIAFYQNAPAAAPYSGVAPSSGYSSGDNSSNSSGYVSKRATCAGCNGTGKCSLCSGRGYNDRGYKCSRCHGLGTCRSCAGVGSKTVF